MAGLTKEALLALKPKVEAVEAPELGEGVEVFIRELNAMDVLNYGALIQSISDAKGNVSAGNVPAMWSALLERSICDADGNLAYAKGQFAEAAIPFSVAQRLFERANAINKITHKEAEAVKKSSDASQISPSLAA